MAASAGLALKASAFLRTSISSARRRVRTANGLQRLTSCARTLLPSGAYCVALVDIWLPPKIQRIGKEAFLCCTSVRELVIPPKLRYLGIRAFCGCDQLSLFTQLDAADSDRVVQAEDDTFLMCDNFERVAWIELLPPRDTDSDAFDEELHKGLY